MAVVKSPNTEYKGVSAGVAFYQGQATCTDETKLKWFREKGYIVEENATLSAEPDSLANEKIKQLEQEKAAALHEAQEAQKAAQEAQAELAQLKSTNQNQGVQTKVQTEQPTAEQLAELIGNQPEPTKKSKK